MSTESNARRTKRPPSPCATLAIKPISMIIQTSQTQPSFEQRSLQVGLFVILCIRELRQVVASIIQGDLLRDTILINITEVLVFEPICAGFSEGAIRCMNNGLQKFHCQRRRTSSMAAMKVLKGPLGPPMGIYITQTNRISTL